MSDNYIQILNYGIGNIRSLQNALNKIDIKNIVSEKINQDDPFLKGLILPGVGAFSAAMDLLKNKNLIKSIEKIKQKQIPILGICLGMQILFKTGHEIKKKKGLSFLDGDVLPLNAEKMQIPNIGWRALIRNQKFLNDINNKKFYFVHSYYVSPTKKEIVKYFIDYEGFKIPAIVNENNLFGFQFHPEKSGKDGLELLKSFCEYSFRNSKI